MLPVCYCCGKRNAKPNPITKFGTKTKENDFDDVANVQRRGNNREDSPKAHTARELISSPEQPTTAKKSDNFG